MSRREKNRYVLGLLIASCEREARRARGAWKVVCKCCLREFKSFVGPNQAGRCAALVVRRKFYGKVGVLGQYGSKYDLTFFPFKKAPLPVGTDPVCDRCISEMRSSGRVGRGQDWNDPFSLE